MRYETIIAMPDSLEKYKKLGNKLMQLQPHGPLFEKALKEYKRLYKIYNDEYMKKYIIPFTK